MVQIQKNSILGFTFIFEDQIFIFSKNPFDQ